MYFQSFPLDFYLNCCQQFILLFFLPLCCVLFNLTFHAAKGSLGQLLVYLPTAALDSCGVVGVSQAVAANSIPAVTIKTCCFIRCRLIRRRRYSIFDCK